MVMELQGGNTAGRPVALVLGATGGIGGHVAHLLAARGWNVRALSRRADEAAACEPQYRWIQGDATNAADVRRAAQDASLIVHAVNPPGYRDWDKLVLPMLDNTIAAARAVGARILLPGTVYNFGPDAFPDVCEDSPQKPLTRKGAIRAEMERRLEAASRQGVPALVVRAGDFFGPGAGSNWFSQVLVKPGRKVKTVTMPAAAGVGHQWAYLPDVALTMVQLIERARELPDFAVYHMEGLWDADGRQMLAAIGRVAGRSPKVRRFPWWLVRLAAPFVSLFRELGEMRYLWQVPVHMDNARLRGFLGEELRTPLDEAVRATLADLGCLKGRKAAHAAADALAGTAVAPLLLPAPSDTGNEGKPV